MTHYTPPGVMNNTASLYSLEYNGPFSEGNRMTLRRDSSPAFYKHVIMQLNLLDTFIHKPKTASL